MPQPVLLSYTSSSIRPMSSPAVRHTPLLSALRTHRTSACTTDRRWSRPDARSTPWDNESSPPYPPRGYASYRTYSPHPSRSEDYTPRNPSASAAAPDACRPAHPFAPAPPSSADKSHSRSPPSTSPPNRSRTPMSAPAGSPYPEIYTAQKRCDRCCHGRGKQEFKVLFYFQNKLQSFYLQQFLQVSKPIK